MPDDWTETLSCKLFSSDTLACTQLTPLLFSLSPSSFPFPPAVDYLCAVEADQDARIR